MLSTHDKLNVLLKNNWNFFSEGENLHQTAIDYTKIQDKSFYNTSSQNKDIHQFYQPMINPALKFQIIILAIQVTMLNL